MNTEQHFHSFDLTLSNSFSTLQHSTSIDIAPDPLTSPILFNLSNHQHSTPKSQGNNNRPSNKAQRSTISSGSSSSANYGLPHKSNNWRTLIVNCNSIQGKASVFKTVCDYIQPDAVIGTESKLGENVSSSEVFPEEYTVYRRDRSHGGGGVFIMVKNCYTSSIITTPDNDSELIWVKVSLQNTNDLYICSFYRPPHITTTPFKTLSLSLSKFQNNPRKHVIVGGDFNAKDIDWDQHQPMKDCAKRAMCEELLILANDHSLTQLQRKPTREHSVLDLCFVNKPSLVKSSNTIPGISDHDMIVTDMLLKPVINIKPRRKIYKFSQTDWTRIKLDTEQFSKEFLSDKWQGRPVEKNWELLKNHINAMLKKHIPSKLSSQKHQNPWLTTPIKKAIRKKNKLYFKARKTHNKDLWTKYKAAKQQVQKQIRKAEFDYINNILEESLKSKNPKPFWRYIKAKLQDTAGVSPLKDKGILHSDSLSKAKILNTVKV